MKHINNYIEENKERFMEDLFGLIRIPSISSLKENKPEMYRAAEYWKDMLLKSGADKAEIYETEGNPVTYGEKIIDPKLPTVLIYAHMDVMPVDPIEKWISDPFQPEIRDDKIWARGADDDKGQSMMHAKAFELMVKTNTLPCNVKFMIEGEEEIGSPNLGKWCAEHKEMLKADVILVSDTGMIAPDIPSITTGLRGLAYWQVEVTGPSRDLHSGLFGGAVANPINVLCSMIDKMVDEKGKITIPGFYNDVMDVSAEERELLGRAPFDVEKYKKALNLEELAGEEGYSTTERTGIRPTFDVCGIWGGYTGEGAKTVLPSKAFVTHIGLSLLHSRVKYRIRDYASVAHILHKLTYQTELNNYYNKLLGYAFLQIDSIDKSIYHLQKSLLNEGDPEYAQFYLALSYEKKKEFEKSDYFFKEAIKSGISDNLDQYYRGLARINTQKEDYKTVIENYKSSLQYSKDASIYFYMANAAEQYYKDKSRAIGYYNQFLNAKPSDNALIEMARQRVKILKEQRFMKGTGK